MGSWRLGNGIYGRGDKSSIACRILGDTGWLELEGVRVNLGERLGLGLALLHRRLR